MLALTIALQSACVSVHAPSFMEPAPRREWAPTLTEAQFQVSEGNFDAADSVLTKFEARYPGTPEAIESKYWRALVRMDPSNPHASMSNAMQTLDSYLAEPRAKQHVREAAALKRVAAQLDTLNKVVALAQAPKEPSPGVARPQPDLRVDVSRPAADPSIAADLEIKRLKDELAKATAELERIRKRLAQPPRGVR